MEGSYNPIKNSELLDDPESMIFALADTSPREILPIIFLCFLRNALICLMFSGGDDSGSRLQAFNEEEMALLRSDPFSFSSPRASGRRHGPPKSRLHQIPRRRQQRLPLSSVLFGLRRRRSRGAAAESPPRSCGGGKRFGGGFLAEAGRPVVRLLRRERLRRRAATPVGGGVRVAGCGGVGLAGREEGLGRSGSADAGRGSP
ncbi:hypothetical protein C4D60_Mb04t17180 [Musa balbisiana]|uniref:Uncharacterized protein n=1 Tax=Musa balbisiana TaxID=52838 RepID=A0A4S8KCP0_MUSBA|nr:hypothetical protein C4D60_Mb04t17180 [Musa balbisiana]